MGGRRTPLVEVTATGEARVPPDRVRLTLGVECRATTPGLALRQLADDSQRLRDCLDAAAIPALDRQTSTVQLHPIHDPRGRQPAGFRAVHGLVVQLDELAAVGPVLDAVASALPTSLTVGGLAWTVADSAPARARARTLALERAVAQATALAVGLGHRLGPVLRVVEAGEDGSAPVPGNHRRALAGTAAMAVEAGEETVTVSLWCRFALLEPGASA
ncbi:MAG TPA: SIMPL domain-containing protein [Verrucomicrobiae bacterium]|nr:SIMPL domain-containing protein [Verrucomicrobiae bacterium]